MTTDEFERTGKDWFATAKHPRFDRPYTHLAYQPMVELLVHLRVNGFKTYIVSGGGIEFMRVVAERLYGIPPDQVIGSSGKTRYELRNGVPTIVRLAELDFFDDKEGKPIAIQKFIGRRPLAAFGNSDGDLPMLQWTTAGAGRRRRGVDRSHRRRARVRIPGVADRAARAGPCRGAGARLDSRQHERRLETDFRRRGNEMKTARQKGLFDGRQLPDVEPVE